jgi:hypothetical protein
MHSIISTCLLLFGCLAGMPQLLQAQEQPLQQREYYQLTVYRYRDAGQENLLDEYLEKALLPALHRQQFSRIGVFKARANDTAREKKIYVLIPAASLQQLADLQTKLGPDKAYQQAGRTYLDAPYDQPAYTRLETIVLHAFSLAPVLQPPQLQGPRSERTYELRSYESPTEALFRNKVHMFNEGDEIGLFKRLGFNAIFYGEVLAGAQMPNLMYMTSFENRAVRDAHWKAFGSDPQWKQLSAMPEYQHNVSHIDIHFLRPTPYSDY